jgi:hypothetical protein
MNNALALFVCLFVDIFFRLFIGLLLSEENRRTDKKIRLYAAWLALFYGLHSGPMSTMDNELLQKIKKIN